ncbi:MAG: HupE/UreJ family protein [Deltaproteobacteria bacterium]|nr:HupE/UreJ family protein [Deltaproteobacteria bacterium]
MLLAIAALLAPNDVCAHGRSVSYSSFEIDEGGADVTLRLSLLELSRLGPEALPPESFEPGRGADGAQRPDPGGEALSRSLALSEDGRPCPRRGAIRRRAEREGWVRYAWRVDCPTATGALSIRSGVLLDVAPSHLHFARVRFATAPEKVRERVLTEASPVFVVRAGASDGARPAERADGPAGSDFVDYLALGVRHILSGWDHLAFLFGLMLLADRAASIARLVTGFTLAHSLTLALTVAGLVHPRAAAVEAVIAFSVALVAIEKGWLVAGRGRAIPGVVLGGLAGLAAAAIAGASALPLISVVGLITFTACYFALAARLEADWTRVALTFAFGLVHGFGFAGILVELELPPDRLVPALAGFNLGVELGQLAVVALAWPALLLAGRVVTGEGKRWTRDLAVAGLCGLGCFWLVERALAF